ncbi:NAD(P)-binding Rossmann-fold superfamily protein [Arabidopsis thaliana]|nr:NAD(P)-binding Rossmann-fold superfamily protein [Arabidopsis thaliana]AEE33158.1 NAD(P)-binding Rossmann-fold superfamily protein [Arabidopsis thaliana]|eukprot:NP_564670.2 NAD(P)-binding Rossmann-fold superfamily protein [Arabidopsis thaliana]
MNVLCRVFTSSRVLSSNVTFSFSQIPNNTKKPLLEKRRLSPRVCLRAMASEKQKQHAQPGKEHVMESSPQFSSSDYQPSNKLRGKVALITGGDSGIGRAVGYCFASEGATVAFTYVKGQEEKDAQETLQMLKEVKTSDSKEPIAIPTDLGFDENCKRVVDEVVNAFGRIDVLINNAAEQYESSTIEEIDEPRLERVFRTNIFSYFFLTRHALKHMKEGSSIINTTSVNAYKGNASLLDYTATKGAIVAFTRGLALQLAEKGIRVNGVAPGPIWTPLIPASFNEEKIKNFGSEVPMKRAGQPIEVAPSYVFLACNHCSSYFTGQVLHPNGGAVVNA